MWFRSDIQQNELHKKIEFWFRTTLLARLPIVSIHITYIKAEMQKSKYTFLLTKLNVEIENKS